MGFAEPTQIDFFLGPGERAGCVSKEPSLNQVLWNAGAVDGDKGPACTSTGVMRGPGEVFLANARFALNQDRNGLVEHAPGFVGSAAPFQVAGVQSGQGIIRGVCHGVQWPRRMHGQGVQIGLNLYKEGAAIVPIDLCDLARPTLVTHQQIRESRTQNAAQLRCTNGGSADLQQSQCLAVAVTTVPPIATCQVRSP